MTELKDEADKLGVKNRELADRFGYSEPTISQWLNDREPCPSWFPEECAEYLRDRAIRNIEVATGVLKGEG